MQYVLYNPIANNKTGEAAAHAYLDGLVEDAEYKDITTVDVAELISSLGEADRLIIAGGDGTINKLANVIGDTEPACAIDYAPIGSSNDFFHDVKTGDEKLISLNKYIKNLPTVEVNGETHKFINGIGYGIDGYCCEKGDEFKAKSDKPVNYAGIAIKGMLFNFKPRNATVIVDGVEHKYKKVWLVPTMKGRYYGGGMEVAPAQDRLNSDGLTTVVWQGRSRLITLMHFPKIFKGEHVKYTKTIHVFTGKEITVKFDKPTALQIDGETVIGVTEYTARF